MNPNQEINAALDQLREQLSQDPAVGQHIQEVAAEISTDGLPVELLEELLSMFYGTLQNPESYAQVRDEALSTGLADEEDMPPEFNEGFVRVMLSALDLVRDNLMNGAAQGFARGGLAQLGRNGDTMLAHINPIEARMLMRNGGSGSINPETGLPEFGFFKKLKKVFKKIAKIALPVAAMYFGGPLLTSAFGGGLGASMGAGALIGGATAGITGGNPLKGALMGGLGGAFSGWGGGETLGGGVGGSAFGGDSGGMMNAFGDAASSAPSLGSGISGSLGSAAESMGGALGTGIEGGLSTAIGAESYLPSLTSESVPGFEGNLLEQGAQGVKSASNEIPSWMKDTANLGMKGMKLYNTLNPPEPPEPQRPQQFSQSNTQRQMRQPGYTPMYTPGFGMGAGRRFACGGLAALRK